MDIIDNNYIRDMSLIFLIVSHYRLYIVDRFIRFGGQ